MFDIMLDLAFIHSNIKLFVDDGFVGFVCSEISTKVNSIKTRKRTLNKKDNGNKGRITILLHRWRVFFNCESEFGI